MFVLIIFLYYIIVFNHKNFVKRVVIGGEPRNAGLAL